MRSRFQIISENKDFDLMISKGILSIHLMDWIQIYKWYLDELKHYPKMVAYQSTADNFKYSTTQVRVIVAWMES